MTLAKTVMTVHVENYGLPCNHHLHMITAAFAYNLIMLCGVDMVCTQIVLWSCVFIPSPHIHTHISLLSGGTIVASLTASVELLGVEAQANAVGLMYTFFSVAAISSYPFAGMYTNRSVEYKL